MILVRRNGWGARVADEVNHIPTPTPRLWVHHTGSEQHGAAGVREIQNYHMDTKGWNDIAYSFLIDDDGTIYEGRGAGVAGAHTEGDNSGSHAICLMGNFDNRAPTNAALNALVTLARHGRDNRWWNPTLGGHRDAPGASTACPGFHLYRNLGQVKRLVDEPIREDDDMNLDDLKSGPIRKEFKEIATGAGLDALRPRDDAHPDRGAWRGLVAEIIHNELRPIHEKLDDILRSLEP